MTIESDSFDDWPDGDSRPQCDGLPADNAPGDWPSVRVPEARQPTESQPLPDPSFTEAAGPSTTDEFVLDTDCVDVSDIINYKRQADSPLQIDWSGVRGEILRRLDIRRECELLGVQFSAQRPNSGGWLECYSISRKENNPSAAIRVEGDGSALGCYSDLGSDERLSFFDLAAKLQPGSFRDWRDAIAHYARQTGVSLPGRQTPATPAASATPAPRECRKENEHRGKPKELPPLEKQIDVYHGFSALQSLRQWAKTKGLTLEAIQNAGAVVGIWPVRAPDSKKLTVVGLFGYRPEEDRPCSLVLFRPEGKLFPPGPNGHPRTRKIHTVAGSTDGLIVVGGMQAMATAHTIWLVEGPSDAIALSALLPSHHVAATNTAGANKFDVSLTSAFKGKRVIVVCDRDNAGLTGQSIRAALLLPVATEVKILELPYPVWEKHGRDVRDFISDGATLEQFMTLADAAPVVTAADVGNISSESTSDSSSRHGDHGKSDRGNQGSDVQPRIRNFVEQYFVDPESGKEKRTFEPVSFLDIQALVSRETGDWPRRVGSSLFVHEHDGEIHWPDKTSKLFSFLQRRTGILEWREGDKFVTKAELFSGLQQSATKYLAVEEYPHYPPIAEHYYACETPAAGDGTALEGLLDRFAPATPIDRDLMKAALMTLVWGGAGGTRPVFIFTADAGRGKGKSTTASMIARLTGGSCDFSSNDDFETVKKRLLTFTGRVSFLDNVKTLKFSWAELEALITAPTVSGWRLYLGNGSRPNTFTWFITLNGVALSTDLAQRAVIIKVGEPTNSGDWQEDTERYIDTHRTAIIADLISCLKSPGVQPAKYSRWATWEKAVLSRLPEPEDAQRVILDRQSTVDVEKEEIAIVEEFFAQQLRQLQYVSTERVHIPSKIAAEWYCQATREKKTSVGAGRIISQFCDEGRTKNLQRNSCNSYGRGFIWTGDDASPSSPISLDLAGRIAERLAETHY